jgi:hypothetical protein
MLTHALVLLLQRGVFPESIASWLPSTASLSFAIPVQKIRQMFLLQSVTGMTSYL